MKYSKKDAIKKEHTKLVKEYEKEQTINEKYNNLLTNSTTDATNKTKPNLTQKYLKSNVNMYTAEKAYTLDLTNKPNPYLFGYNSSGSHILLYNSDGYISSYNTQKMNVDFEIEEVDERINSAKYLYSEKYLAVAQKYLNIYNSTGQEINVVKEIKNCKHMEYMPWHYLLGCVNNNNLNYYDVSTSKIISTLKDINFKVTSTASFDGLILLGDKNGVVEMKSPNQPQSLMKIKTHRNLKDIQVSHDKMFVSNYDGNIKTFDLRNYFKEMEEFKCKNVKQFTVSRNNSIAVLNSKNISILRDNSIVQTITCNSNTNSLQFNPFEDILTTTSNNSLSNFIVPNTTDKHYNTDYVSPYATVAEKKEREVKMLLEKIPYEMISYNSGVLRGKKVKKVKLLKNDR